MKTRILREAVGLLDAVLDTLIETATRASSDAAAQLRRQCGAVMAQAPALRLPRPEIRVPAAFGLLPSGPGSGLGSAPGRRPASQGVDQKLPT